MTRITNTEPRHWHDADGNHRMPDPRLLATPQPVINPETGQPTGQMSSPPSKGAICHGDPDLALYWSHLDAHDQLQTTPEPRHDDSLEIRSLFAKIASNEAQTKVLRMLIITLREKDTHS